MFYLIIEMANAKFPSEKFSMQLILELEELVKLLSLYHNRFANILLTDMEEYCFH